MFVFRPDETRRQLVDGFDLPCVSEASCNISLVMCAWHPDARAGGKDVVLVGANEGNYLDNGIVQGDKGRLMVVRERGLEAGDAVESETTGDGAVSVPTTIEPVVVYSHPLKPGEQALLRDEQYLVEAKMVTDVDGRARVSTRMFLTKNPLDASPGALDATFPKSIGEHNGVNCTPGTSPCTTRKVAVFRVSWVLDPLDQVLDGARVEALGERYATIVEKYTYVDGAGRR